MILPILRCTALELQRETRSKPPQLGIWSVPRRQEPLPIGSVKTNIGHLEPASGMAGLLKAALALERGVLPPSLHCESPNPKIDFAALNLRLVRTAEPILMSSERRIAGVNSFGFGGTNAHVVLAAPPPAPGPTEFLSAAAAGNLRSHRGFVARIGPQLAKVANDGCGHAAARPIARRSPRARPSTPSLGHPERQSQQTCRCSRPFSRKRDGAGNR